MTSNLFPPNSSYNSMICGNARRQGPQLVDQKSNRIYFLCRHNLKAEPCFQPCQFPQSLGTSFLQKYYRPPLCPFQFGCSWLHQHIRGQCPRKLKPRLRIRVTEIRQEEQCHVTHSVVTIGMDNPLYSLIINVLSL